MSEQQASIPEAEIRRICNRLIHILTEEGMKNEIKNEIKPEMENGKRICLSVYEYEDGKFVSGFNLPFEIDGSLPRSVRNEIYVATLGKIVSAAAAALETESEKFFLDRSGV